VNLEEFKEAKRGVDLEDSRWFSEGELRKLRMSQKDVLYLLDRGYKLNSIIDLVGGRFQFSARQRTALQRGTSSTKHCKTCLEKLVPIEAAKESIIHIDGFNLIITLEVALSGGTLLLCNDSTIRDLAGLRGTYRIIDKTYIAASILGNFFDKLQVPKVMFYLDSPVSNSGRLKTLIREISENWYTKVEIELVPNADTILSNMERVITSDSIILDECSSWMNILPDIIDQYIGNARLINFSGEAVT
jgi:Uncharacterized conserved protein